MTDLCEVCGTQAAACAECGRCSDVDCNAGCMFCRHKNEWDPQTRFMVDHPLITLALIGAVIAVTLWRAA